MGVRVCGCVLVVAARLRGELLPSVPFTTRDRGCEGQSEFEYIRRGSVCATHTLHALQRCKDAHRYARTTVSTPARRRLVPLLAAPPCESSYVLGV